MDVVQAQQGVVLAGQGGGGRQAGRVPGPGQAEVALAEQLGAVAGVEADAAVADPQPGRLLVGLVDGH